MDAEAQPMSPGGDNEGEDGAHESTVADEAQVLAGTAPRAGLRAQRASART
jgi:hypothetical protein